MENLTLQWDWILASLLIYAMIVFVLYFWTSDKKHKQKNIMIKKI